MIVDKKNLGKKEESLKVGKKGKSLNDKYTNFSDE
jgi:hypothetical protein